MMYGMNYSLSEFINILKCHLKILYRYVNFISLSVTIKNADISSGWCKENKSLQDICEK